MASKLHQGHPTGSRNIQNGWILSGQPLCVCVCVCVLCVVCVVCVCVCVCIYIYKKLQETFVFMSSTVLSDQWTKQQTKKQGTTKQMEKERKRKRERKKIKLKMFAFEYEFNSDTWCLSWIGLHMIFTCSFLCVATKPAWNEVTGGSFLLRYGEPVLHMRTVLSSWTHTFQYLSVIEASTLEERCLPDLLCVAKVSNFQSLWWIT